MTFLWRWVWCLLWLAGTIAALMVGGAILTHALRGLRVEPHGFRYLPGRNAVTTVNLGGRLSGAWSRGRSSPPAGAARWSEILPDQQEPEG